MGLRRSDTPRWKEIISSTGSFIGTSPASADRAWFARKWIERRCAPNHLSPTSVAVDYYNASLTLWLDESDFAWTPWNTFSELGGHAVANSPAQDTTAQGHWTRVVDNLIALTENISSAPSLGLNLILSGEAWTEDSISTFEEILQHSKAKMKFGVQDIIHQDNPFVASMVRTANGALDVHWPCPSRAAREEIIHDEV